MIIIKYNNNIQMFIHETSCAQWEVLPSLLLFKAISKIKSYTVIYTYDTTTTYNTTVSEVVVKKSERKRIERKSKHFNSRQSHHFLP